MSYITDDQKEKLYHIVERKFTAILFSKINSLIEFIDNVSDIREDFPDYDESMLLNKLEKAREIIKLINSLIDKQFKKTYELKSEMFISHLIDDLDTELSLYEPFLIEEQNVLRFTPVSADGKTIKIVKRLKLTTWKFYSGMLSIKNFAAKKLKLKQKEIRFWNHSVPVRNLAYYHLRDNLLKALALVFEDVCKEYNKAAISFWKFDESIDQNFLNNFIPEEARMDTGDNFTTPLQIVKKLETFKTEVALRINGIVDERVFEFQTACEKAGTLELTSRKFNDEKTKTYHDNVKSDFETMLEEWDNNHFSLGEEWKLNCELESAGYFTLRLYYKFEKSISVRLKIQVHPPFYNTSQTLKTVLQDLLKGKSENESFIRKLRSIKAEIQNELLTSTIPGLINTITDMQIPGMIDETSEQIKYLLNELAEVRSFVIDADYSTRFKTGSLNQIYPREFLLYAAIPNLAENLKKIKSDFNADLKNIQSELINLGNMADFSIESGITADSSKDLTESEITEIVSDGIKLSIDKNEQLSIDYQEICENVLQKMKRAIIFFNREIFGITSASELFDISEQLSKTRQKSKVFKLHSRYYSWLGKIIPDLLSNVKRVYNNGPAESNHRYKQTQLSKNHMHGTTLDVSGYLSKLESSFEHLPYIYRRLFHLTPLENNRLFVQRVKAEQALQNAFRSWIDGQYSPVILTAEKGSGKTSFLNLNVPAFGDQFSITWLSIKPTIYTSDKLLELFRPVVNIDSLSDYKEIIKILNKSASRRIIVVENLQHMFLRYVNGFTALKQLLEIIAATNKNVFWITSSSKFAFSYLKSAVNINDLFSYHIELENINDEQMLDLIKKRHSISGYSLQFETSRNIAGSKEALKAGKIEYQKFLEKFYFSTLNYVVNSNISLALLFWLGSVINIKERTLYVSAQLEVSEDLLNFLAPEKIFVLQSLVLHDGLKIAEMNKTLNNSLSETTLLLQVLSDDKIINKTDDVYYLNPFLYRQIIALLKSKNFLD